MADDFRDVMSIGYEKVFVPYQTEDGWTVVLPGEEDGRRGAKELIAVSRVEIRLETDDQLRSCLAHLEESDRRLRLMNSQSWDWQKVSVKGTTVRFGVAWYNRSFFEQKKHSWSSAYHNRIYNDFQATAENFTVIHELKG